MSDLGLHFERGLELLRGQEFFEAHEERDFFQGLVHVAVAWYQAGRANRRGCERQLEKATRRLGPFAPEHRGVDVADVLAQVGRAQAAVGSGSLALDPPRL